MGAFTGSPGGEGKGDGKVGQAEVALEPSSMGIRAASPSLENLAGTVRLPPKTQTQFYASGIPPYSVPRNPPGYWSRGGLGSWHSDGTHWCRSWTIRIHLGPGSRSRSPAYMCVLSGFPVTEEAWAHLCWSVRAYSPPLTVEGHADGAALFPGTHMSLHGLLLSASDHVYRGKGRDHQLPCVVQVGQTQISSSCPLASQEAQGPPSSLMVLPREPPGWILPSSMGSQR